MNSKVTRTDTGEPTIARLRTATRDIHLSLHAHPLIVELLTHPSRASYRTVLQAFLSFYLAAEPAVVEAARRFGVAEFYPRQERTDWLSADLDILDSEVLPVVPSDEHQAVPEMAGRGELIGWMYVIRGSALGGRAILSQLRGRLDVTGCCRFLSGDGERANRNWEEFQRLGNAITSGECDKQAATSAATTAFRAINECLTRSFQQLP